MVKGYGEYSLLWTGRSGDLDKTGAAVLTGYIGSLDGNGYSETDKVTPFSCWCLRFWLQLSFIFVIFFHLYISTSWLRFLVYAFIHHE